MHEPAEAQTAAEPGGAEPGKHLQHHAQRGRQQRNQMLDLLTKGALHLADVHEMAESVPALGSTNVVTVLKAMPDATDQKVASMVWASRLRRPNRKTRRLSPVKVRDMDAEEWAALAALWSRGGPKVVPHDGWPFWPE